MKANPLPPGIELQVFDELRDGVVWSDMSPVTQSLLMAWPQLSFSGPSQDSP